MVNETIGRFTGTLEPFADVDVTEVVDWLQWIPEADWPKQNDAKQFEHIATDLTERFYPGCTVSGVGFFVLEPGQLHPAHTDVQPPYWITRVHVPIATNPFAVCIMDDGEHHMAVGKAYRFNTTATHEVFNGGKTPRVHLVFDIRG